MALQVGDKAPDLLGLNQDGKEIRLSDFAAKKVVLYFYPKDQTPGCTAQACSLRDGYDDLRKAGYEVIGGERRFGIVASKVYCKAGFAFSFNCRCRQKTVGTIRYLGREVDVWSHSHGHVSYHFYY